MASIISPWTRRGLRAAAVLAVLAVPGSAEKLQTSLGDGRIVDAFEKVLDDPFFERFTGLKILDKTPTMGGTQSFKFTETCVERTVHETPKEQTTTYSWGYKTERWTERQTETRTTVETKVIAYLPTVELPKKRDGGGAGKMRLYCGFGEFGKKASAGVNLFSALGGLAGAVSKGILMGVTGEKEWSAGGGCAWEPFNPGPFAQWVGDKWLPWRFEQFSSGEDTLAVAFDLFSRKRYREAQPYFQSFADHFGYGKRKNESGDRDVFPYQYTTNMPEFFAILGDIYRLGFNDPVKAEENYLIGSSIAGAPFLAETAGVARANRGLGMVLADRARQARADARKAAILGEKSAFFLYAYLGFYKDREAPEHDQIMALIKEVDPEQIRLREREVQTAQEVERKTEERKKEKTAVKALMEY